MKTFFYITLFLLFIILWYRYWRLQLVFNSSLLDHTTPDAFELYDDDDRYHKLVDTGTSIMSRSRVVICSLLRDVEKNIPSIIKRVERVGSKFLDYRVIIVENDSIDNTRKLLLQWSNRNDKIIILGCGVYQPTCTLTQAQIKTDDHTVSANRISKMVYLRNIYLDFIKSHYRYFDYTIVWDLDIVGSVYIDGIANSFGWFPLLHADAICAYGIYKWSFLKLYYDTYAHIDYEDQFHINLKSIHDVRKGLGHQYSRGETPIQVRSCFSGFTIYMTSSLLPHRYEMSLPDNIECEHAVLNKNLTHVYMNPSMIHYVLHNE
jgi:hypothetical protein